MVVFKLIVVCIFLIKLLSIKYKQECYYANIKDEANIENTYNFRRVQ